MKHIIIDRPYEFVPPQRSSFWVRIVRPYLPRYLKHAHGLVDVECRGAELLRASIVAGHGVLVAPNHCRPCDPMVMAVLSGRVKRPFFTMASWHLFAQKPAQRWFIRRMGAFSVYREGTDRVAVAAAIDMLAAGERPLVIFPEGVISRSNDVLFDLMGGTAFIARSAAKRRAKVADSVGSSVAPRASGRVVVHPVAIKYLFSGDLEATLAPVLTDIEARLTWRPQTNLPLVERIVKLGKALLALKEMEYLGAPREGPIAGRVERLINHLLSPIEAEWSGGASDGDVVARVKRLRIAMLPDLVAGTVDEPEGQRRWRQLEDLNLAQQLFCFPPEYVGSGTAPERVLETVERFEEDITGVARVHPPMRAIVQVGAALEVDTARPPKGGPDPLLEELELRLKSMLKALTEEAAARRAGAPR